MDEKNASFEFGDGERAARILGIKGIQVREYIPKNTTKKEAEKLFSEFEPVKKAFIADFIEPSDSKKHPRTTSKYGNKARSIVLKVIFPKNTVGKLRGFFNTKTANIISEVRAIFDNAQYAFSTNYIIKDIRFDGSLHKEKSNIEAYHHFVNKVTVDSKTFYIRFTVEELKSIGQLHSVIISEVEIINKKSREDRRSLPGLHLGGTAQPAYDESLIDFFNSVKEKFSIDEY
jgi:hypothetical protein